MEEVKVLDLKKSRTANVREYNGQIAQYLQ